MSAASHTPADLTITPRDLAFGRQQAPAHWWYGGQVAPTAFYNALSMTFPAGESFFIRSVRHYRDEVAEPLKSQIGDFIAQEAVHSREHVHFNRQVADSGYDLADVQAAFDQRMAQTRGRPPLLNLAATVAFEHFTAILAHAWLKHDRYFRGAPGETRRLWQWHALEEIEHKAVAYDTFLAVTGDMPGWKRWMLRANVMLRITPRFLRGRLADMKLMFQQDGVDTASTWLKVFSYLVIYPGLLRQVLPLWLMYFRPGFHPWMHDDRDLLVAAAGQLGDNAPSERAVA
jgi:predicted metal-dependent hydrolase